MVCSITYKKDDIEDVQRVLDEVNTAAVRVTCPHFAFVLLAHVDGACAVVLTLRVLCSTCSGPEGGEPYGWSARARARILALYTFAPLRNICVYRQSQ